MRKSGVKEAALVVSFSDCSEDSSDTGVFHHVSAAGAVDSRADLRLNPLAGESTKSVETLWRCSWRNFSDAFGRRCADDEG